MLDIKGILKKWSTVHEKIKVNKITVHAWLVDGVPTRYEETTSTLYIVFKNTIHMEVTKKPNNTKLIEDTLLEVYGREINIKCVRLVEEIERKNQLDPSQIYSVELIFVLENGTRLSSFDTLINLLNIDDKYIIQSIEQDANKYKGQVIKDMKPTGVEMQVNKYKANFERDIVYKIIVYGIDIDDTENYVSHVIDLVYNRKEVKNKYILWDGISQYYCSQAYSLINQVENRMRSFLTEFLCRKIGQLAFQDTLSSEIKESIKNNHQKTLYTDFNTALFNVEFRELGDFLFKQFDEFKNKEDIIQEIRKCRDMDELNQLKKRLPNSNWNKYFKDIVSSNDLQSNWNSLLKFRNIVAHNKILTKSEYEHVKSIVNNILRDIENAIDSLDYLNINDEEQKKISFDLDQAVNEQKTGTCDDCNRHYPSTQLIPIEDMSGVHILSFCGACYERQNSKWDEESEEFS